MISPSSVLSLFGHLFPQLGKGRELAEKARLEAFLSAYPGEYCGFNPDGSLVYSQGFLSLLDLKEIKTLADIQQALRPGDAAALEACFFRLLEHREKFVLRVETADESHILRLTGAAGSALTSDDRFDILWIEDITPQEKDFQAARASEAEKEEELRRLESVLHAFEHPVWLRNLTGRIFWCNRAYAEIANLSPETILNDQKDLAFTTAKKKSGSAKSITELSEDALKTGLPISDQKYLIVKGDRRLMKVDILPIPHLDLSVGIARDISREETLEQEAERNMAATRDLLEQLRAAVGIFGVDQKLVFYNSAYSQLWKLDDPFLSSQPKLGDILERLRETRRLPEQADFRRYKQGWIDMFTSLITAHEDMLHLPDGTALRMIVMPRPMGGLMMTFEDVTSRLELESSYNTLIAVQKETLDNLAEGVAVFAENGRLQLSNPAFSAIWDLHPENLAGHPHIGQIVDRFQKFFPEDAWAKAREETSALALSHSEKSGEISRADGRVVTYTSVALPDGGTLLTYQDVTDAARVEHALREKADALETAERLKLDFLANVSYQLRTPLNAIIGFTEILDKEYFGPLNTRQKEYTKGLGEAGERLMNLVNDILDLSTIEAGYMTLTREAVDVRAMLTSLFDLTQEWARSQRIEVGLSCPDDIGEINADERRMKQVLLNLIRNAIDFTPAGGKIILSAQRVPDGVNLSVTDTGPGIAAEDQERIFRPFEKTDAPRDDGEGNSRGGGWSWFVACKKHYRPSRRESFTRKRTGPRNHRHRRFAEHQLRNANRVDFYAAIGFLVGFQRDGPGESGLAVEDRGKRPQDKSDFITRIKRPGRTKLFFFIWSQAESRFVVRLRPVRPWVVIRPDRTSHRPIRLVFYDSALRGCSRQRHILRIGTRSAKNKAGSQRHRKKIPHRRILPHFLGFRDSPRRRIFRMDVLPRMTLAKNRPRRLGRFGKPG
jgi:signal transduction histidine kinase